MRVSTNINSMVAIRTLQGANNRIAKSESQLSSGERICRAAYDPAGLAISETMRAKVRGLGQVERNINDGVSLMQVADGSLSIISELGIRLRELAMQAANDTVDAASRHMADLEFQQVKTEISRLAKSTQFNGQHLLSDTEGPYDLQIGLNNVDGVDRFVYDINKMLESVNDMRVSGFNIRSKESSQKVIGSIGAVMDRVSSSRAKLGSIMKRMESVMENAQVSRVNLSSAKSQIRDTDYALETSNRVTGDIQKHAAAAMLSIANHRPEGVLRLLS